MAARFEKNCTLSGRKTGIHLAKDLFARVHLAPPEAL